MIQFRFQTSPWETAKYHNGFVSSGGNLTINVHCSGKSAPQIGKFSNRMQFLSVHSDVWFAVRLSKCWLVHHFSPVSERALLSKDCETRSIAPSIFLFDLAFYVM